MTPTPYVIDGFGGIRLDLDSVEIGAAGATAAADVALDTPGQIRTRDGYTSFATTTTAPSTVHVHTHVGSATQVLCSSSTKLEAFDAFGTGIATVAATGPHSFVSAGTPSTPVAYACASGDASLRKWNGVAWSTVAGAPANARAIAWDPDSSRLVAAGHNGGDRVQWSDAGAPDTWTASNFVDLTPGDGEFITAACTWQGLIFVFKQTKMFVFTGESTNSAGQPSFNYRTVNGVGATQGVGSATVCVAPHGVYVLSRDGLYLTTGGLPVLVSQPLVTLFRSGSPALVPTNFLGWHQGRLIARLGSSATLSLYVWYRETDSWSRWTIQDGKTGGSFAAGDDLGTSNSYLFFVNGTDSAIYAMRRTDTTDNGTAISWSYTSGLYSPASDRSRVAISLESQLLGSGSVTLKVATTGGASSSSGALDTGSAVTLGTAPAIAEGWQQIDREGALWQHQLSGTGAAVVTGLSHHISFVKPAGIW